jgi:hypothetical protein
LFSFSDKKDSDYWCDINLESGHRFSRSRDNSFKVSIRPT